MESLKYVFNRRSSTAAKTLDIGGIKPFVEHYDDCMKSFLRGFFDSDDSVNKVGVIVCYNSDMGILEYVQTLLSSLCIEKTRSHLQVEEVTIYSKEVGKTYTAKRDVYHLNIRTSCS